MATDLSATIATEAADPQSSASDGMSATGRNINDLIAADTYLAGVVARNKRRRGIALTKMIPPGALSDQGGVYGYGPFNSTAGVP